MSDITGKVTIMTEQLKEITELPPIHIKARSTAYLGAPHHIRRTEFTDKFVRWDMDFQDYNPPVYTCSRIIETKPFWADPDIL